jgi:hypothetical protein
MSQQNPLYCNFQIYNYFAPLSMADIYIFFQTFAEKIWAS